MISGIKKCFVINEILNCQLFIVYMSAKTAKMTIVQDPHIRKFTKNGRTGHSFLYFFNAIFLLVWTLGS